MSRWRVLLLQQYKTNILIAIQMKKVNVQNLKLLQNTVHVSSQISRELRHMVQTFFYGSLIVEKLILKHVKGNSH